MDPIDETADEFQQDLQKVVEIAKERVAMFDLADGTYAGPHSNQLWREYKNLRKKYGGNASVRGMKLFHAYNEQWDK